MLASIQRPVRKSKADLPSMKDDMKHFSKKFTDKHSIKEDVDTMWTEFNSRCEQLMTDFNHSNSPHLVSASHGSTET